MRRAALFALIAVAALPAASPAAAERAGFRLADGSVRCELVAPSRLLCTAASAGSLVLGASGGPADSRRAAAPQAAVLRVGARWSAGGIRCLVVRTSGTPEVRCSNARGGLLALSAGAAAGLAPAAVSP